MKPQTIQLFDVFCTTRDNSRQKEIWLRTDHKLKSTE
jgi:hypothetical protein